jgi:hypothetical protein
MGVGAKEVSRRMNVPFCSVPIQNGLLICDVSQLSLENKLLVHKAILKPIRTYGVQLWGTASNSNIDILERFQSKVLRIITDAPWYVPNTMIRRDLQVLPVKQEVRNYSITYRHRLENQPNRLAKSLFPGPTLNRRLKRCHPADLQTIF